MMAKVVDVKDQAMWLAQGYVQGQRDLLIQMLEHRFSKTLPKAMRSQLATIPAHALESLGPLLLSAPTLDAVSEAADELVANQFS
jgi:hypothetical protein